MKPFSTLSLIPETSKNLPFEKPELLLDYQAGLYSHPQNFTRDVVYTVFNSGWRETLGIGQPVTGPNGGIDLLDSAYDGNLFASAAVNAWTGATRTKTTNVGPDGSTETWMIFSDNNGYKTFPVSEVPITFSYFVRTPYDHILLIRLTTSTAEVHEARYSVKRGVLTSSPFLKAFFTPLIEGWMNFGFSFQGAVGAHRLDLIFETPALPAAEFCLPSVYSNTTRAYSCLTGRTAASTLTVDLSSFALTEGTLLFQGKATGFTESVSDLSNVNFTSLPEAGDQAAAITWGGGDKVVFINGIQTETSAFDFNTANKTLSFSASGFELLRVAFWPRRFDSNELSVLSTNTTNLFQATIGRARVQEDYLLDVSTAHLVAHSTASEASLLKEAIAGSEVDTTYAGGKFGLNLDDVSYPAPATVNYSELNTTIEPYGTKSDVTLLEPDSEVTMSFSEETTVKLISVGELRLFHTVASVDYLVESVKVSIPGTPFTYQETVVPSGATLKVRSGESPTTYLYTYWFGPVGAAANPSAKAGVKSYLELGEELLPASGTLLLEFSLPRQLPVMPLLEFYDADYGYTGGLTLNTEVGPAGVLAEGYNRLVLTWSAEEIGLSLNGAPLRYDKGGLSNNTRFLYIGSNLRELGSPSLVLHRLLLWDETMNDEQVRRL